jgi:hypothetical protein
MEGLFFLIFYLEIVACRLFCLSELFQLLFVRYFFLLSEADALVRVIATLGSIIRNLGLTKVGKEMSVII